MEMKKMIAAAAMLGVAMATGTCAGTTFLLAGDSTLDDYGRKNRPPYASWGTTLEKSMKPGCKVDNYARSGASTKSFIESGQWAKLVAAIKPGDFVGIQFGHNDQKWSKPFYVEKRFADPNGLFRENVRKFVAEIRAKGGKPILMSPIVRGTFGKDGKLTDHVDKKGISLGSYAKAMKELGEELKVDFVDMNRLTHDLLEKVGKEESMKFFVISTGLVKGKDGEPSKDVTHPIAAGAEAFSKLFIEDVKARKLDVASMFK
jgi:pectinesterase